jgi:hypothetical protein
MDINYQEDGESVSKLSDIQFRISSIKQDLKHLHSSFQHALAEMKRQSQHQASQQSLHKATLSEILSLLRKSNVSNPAEITLASSARDNPPKQSQPSGGSEGAAGTG